MKTYRFPQFPNIEFINPEFEYELTNNEYISFYVELDNQLYGFDFKIKDIGELEEHLKQYLV